MDGEREGETIPLKDMLKKQSIAEWRREAKQRRHRWKQNGSQADPFSPHSAEGNWLLKKSEVKR